MAVATPWSARHGIMLQQIYRLLFAILVEGESYLVQSEPHEYTRISIEERLDMNAGLGIGYNSCPYALL
jgi:hypothetical protein